MRDIFGRRKSDSLGGKLFLFVFGLDLLVCIVNTYYLSRFFLILDRMNKMEERAQAAVEWLERQIPPEGLKGISR